MNFKNYILPVACLILLNGCSGTKSEETRSTSEIEQQEEVTAKPTYEVSEQFQQQLSQVRAAYLSVKDAFVLSDTAAVRASIPAMKNALAGVDAKLLPAETVDKWNEYLSGMDGALIEMKVAQDIEVQRSAFSILSDNLYKGIKAFGTGSVATYYQFCPMAFNDKGGYWLSEEETIRNPYFGDKMLRCGSVKEVLK